MKRFEAGVVPTLYLLLHLISLGCTRAAVIDTKYTVNQRPRSLEHTERSALEARKLNERTIPSCGDPAGQQVDLQNLVATSVAAGLPHASDAGVVFMEAAVTGLDACGPYTCYVSSDATGTSWSNMIMLQNVPQISEGCGTTNEEDSYTVVASFPEGITCTGLGGACLIMCKAQAMPLGNCAAVAWEKPASPASPITAPTSSSSVSSISIFTSSPVQISTSISLVHTFPSQSTTITTPASGTIMLPLSSSSSSTSTTSTIDAVKAAFTLRGFSGNDGPGGPAEQHLNFGHGSSFETVNTVLSTSGSASAYQVGKMFSALVLSTALAWTFL